MITINKEEMKVIKQIVKEMKNLIKRNKNYYSFGKYTQPLIEKWKNLLGGMIKNAKKKKNSK